MSYVPPGQQQAPQPQLNYVSASAQAPPQSSGAYDPQGQIVPGQLPPEEEQGMSTGAKVAIGAAVGVGAVAVVAAGVGALAVGGYYLYDSHEAKQQNASELKLNFRALSGHGLKSEDFGGKSDPYLEVEVDRVAVATKEARGTLDPVWNEEMTVGIYAEHIDGGSNIVVTVKDKDRGRNDETLGKAHVAFATIPANRPKRFDLALDTKGSVQVEMWLSGPGAKDGARVTPPQKRRNEAHSAGGASHRHGNDNDESRRRRNERRRRKRDDYDDDDFEDTQEEDRRHNRRAGRKAANRRRNDESDDDKDDSPVRNRRNRRDRARAAGDRGRGKGLRKVMSDGAYIHLESHATDKNLRILKDGSIDAKGGRGKWAKFEVYREDRPRTFKLRNVGDDSHWLAIDGPEVVAEDEEHATVFIAVKNGPDEIGLKDMDTNRWVAAFDDFSVSAKKKRNDKVGPHVAFTIIPCE